MPRHPIVVLSGGPSPERAISLESGAAVAAALERTGHTVISIDPDYVLPTHLNAIAPEVVWNALHGPFGEDGVVQGCLETMGIPYTGSGVLGSALAMDKLRSKRVWTAVALPTPRFAELHPGSLETVGLQLDWPLVVKPACSGSSLGVSRVRSLMELESAWEEASQYGSVVMVEEWIEGAEVTVGILEDRALPVLSLQTPRSFYDYTAKYSHGADTCYSHPTPLGPAMEKHCQALALEAFRALDCFGWGRVDLRVGESGPCVLEVNTIPGMTDHSLVPKAATHDGIEFDTLVLRILEMARPTR